MDNDSNQMTPLIKFAGLKYWEILSSMPDQTMIDLLSYDERRSRSERISLFRHNVSIINIETSTACNRSCTYCPDSIYDRKRQNRIADAVWEKIVSNIHEIQYCATVSLNLYNEPLLDDAIYSRVSDIKAAAPASTVKFNSNGDFVNIRTLEKLAESGLDRLLISLHPPNGRPYRDEVQLGSFRKFFNRIGNRMSITEHHPNKSIRAETSFGPISILVMSDNWYTQGNDRAGLLDSLKKSSPRQSPCMRVFREIVIANTGDTFPCCQFFPDDPNNQKFVLGNVSSDDIFDIYASKQATQWRRDLFNFSVKKPPCQTCKDPDNAPPDTNKNRVRLLQLTAHGVQD